ncbi:hypothetical protein BDV96DRAFT_281694 [Lophiotrema nucula]|uniref:Uncharacterized protein n=1 Tax=Lophiotrema nucula TaxID=690887 RepID=A0A6A5ZP11_9PLEO|nr:hypothetical protein BDV96DRAFT_281694 [Lophiotrema nucula]
MSHHSSSNYSEALESCSDSSASLLFESNNPLRNRRYNSPDQRQANTSARQQREARPSPNSTEADRGRSLHRSAVSHPYHPPTAAELQLPSSKSILIPVREPVPTGNDQARRLGPDIVRPTRSHLPTDRVQDYTVPGQGIWGAYQQNRVAAVEKNIGAFEWSLPAENVVQQAARQQGDTAKLDGHDAKWQQYWGIGSRANPGVKRKDVEIVPEQLHRMLNVRELNRELWGLCEMQPRKEAQYVYRKNKYRTPRQFQEKPWIYPAAVPNEESEGSPATVEIVLSGEEDGGREAEQRSYGRDEQGSDSDTEGEDSDDDVWESDEEDDEEDEKGEVSENEGEQSEREEKEQDDPGSRSQTSRQRLVRRNSLELNQRRLNRA